MRQMVGHEMKSLPQRTPKNLLGDAAHLAEPQQESLLDTADSPTNRGEIASGAVPDRTNRPRDRYRRA